MPSRHINDFFDKKETEKNELVARPDVVQLGGKNLEVAVMRKPKDKKEESRMVMLPVEEVEKYVTEIEEEKEKEAAAKRPAEKSSD